MGIKVYKSANMVEWKVHESAQKAMECWKVSDKQNCEVKVTEVQLLVGSWSALRTVTILL